MTEGEAWAEELLRELRSRRYRPRAWTCFLATSFARAHGVRQQRRREHRQALLAGAVGLTAWVAVAPVRPWLALAGALWSLLVTAMLDSHLGMLENNDGQPLHRLGLPNLLALARAATAPALPVVSPALLAILLIPVGISDGIDGPLARRRGEETRLGAWLDGSVDTLVLSAAAVWQGARARALRRAGSRRAAPAGRRRLRSCRRGRRPRNLRPHRGSRRAAPASDVSGIAGRACPPPGERRLRARVSSRRGRDGRRARARRNGAHRGCLIRRPGHALAGARGGLRGVRRDRRQQHRLPT